MDWREMPPLAALRAFAALAETGSMSAAGRALNVSHAAISQQVRALEDRLEVSLLDRSGARPVLSAQGRALAQSLREGFGTIAEGLAALSAQGANRPLQISTTPSFASAWLLPRLPDFRAAHPEVGLSIDPGATLSTLAPGGIEMALRYGSGHWPGLEARLLVRSPIVVVAAPDLVGDVPYDCCPADLSGFPWLQELGTNEASEWLAEHASVRDAPAGMVSMPGNLMLEAARRGQGVAITARVWVEEDLEAGRLRLLFEDSAQKGYYVVTRPGVQRPQLRAFISWLFKTAQGLR
ncbi:LysR family transcriptional regulator [Thioclava dalianensis]|uniref:LysR family transcriptional regulator n=1 Tax=Thioclava dalianensis TaxID=1185766 RepID=A0A074TJD9_9RHOB|nr:LysR family transcriptional regulator [Thioclava dalianensis]KEP70245.1 LysR family transcriptional regulator [Thioclava dalianensis]SFM82761.1 LysR family transcriptional regulator, glycine cleavage system transcriptional activator [Thioclava dalianensis]